MINIERIIVSTYTTRYPVKHSGPWVEKLNVLGGKSRRYTTPNSEDISNSFQYNPLHNNYKIMVRDDPLLTSS